jgi:crotonobetainyl-CoA:carnitine CoA-transferase CaiB-like acyl-CoA transferase
VIKVEPLTGDPMGGVGGLGAPKTTQGKERIALDLRTEAGRGILLDLVRRADVLFHNYRPGAPERLGIDYDSLRKINPRLVYIYAGAYGSTGPYARRPAFHPAMGAASGGVRYQAGQGVPPPPGTPMSIDELTRISMHLAMANEINPDCSAAMGLGTAIAAAVYIRHRTGEGLYLETTMLGSNAYAVSDDFIQYPGKPPRKLPDAELYGLGALYRLYECRTGWVFLGVAGARDWDRLHAALARTGIGSDPRFATAEAREANEGDLAAVLSAIFLSRDAGDWENELTALGVGCVVADTGRYCDVFLDDPHLALNEMVVSVSNPVQGPYRRHAPGIDLELTPGVAGGGALVGQHSCAILAELGYGDAEIQQLRTQRVVFAPE